MTAVGLKHFLGMILAIFIAWAVGWFQQSGYSISSDQAFADSITVYKTNATIDLQLARLRVDSALARIERTKKPLK